MHFHHQLPKYAATSEEFLNLLHLRPGKDLLHYGFQTPCLKPGLAARILLEYEVGEFSQGEHYLEQLLEVMRQTMPGPTVEYAYPAMVIPLVARTSGVVEKFDIAKTAAEACYHRDQLFPLSPCTLGSVWHGWQYSLVISKLRRSCTPY